ncbi:MAG TPA: recombinase family protein [Candidatus Pacearchaeota archaeon]|nr:recombinase family protein [Candidatus Pacearchaeota archaeon]
MKYAIYARKSSESEERQVQSIDDQVNRLKKLANELGLNVCAVYTEAKSAKMPNNRPVFAELIDTIKNGEIDAILCWQMNRLFRNPVDSGNVSWLLQKGVLKAVRTYEREYLPEDNVVLFSLESGVANQFILDLVKNVKRGVQCKLEKGGTPGIPPIGYLNDRLEKTIIIDPERFTIVRKMWDLMLTGNYTAPKILKIANKEWGLRTRKFKRLGGRELSMSGIYKIFTNQYYTGLVIHKDKTYQGNHQPMITFDEYDRVQELLGRKGKPRPKNHEFAFTGMIRCAECGCLITAETKKKYIKSNNTYNHYTYYHCTRKRKDLDCSQKKCLREDELTAQIDAELAKFTILPQFKDWALQVLNKQNDQEILNRAKTYEMQQRTLTKTQQELDNLSRMRYREEIDEDFYTREKSQLQEKISRLREQVRLTEDRADKWLELTEKAFDFAVYARARFNEGDLMTKKEILSALGSNFLLKDGIISINRAEWLEPIVKSYPAIEKEYLRLEPAINFANKEKTEVFASVISRWQGRKESNPQ